jgi:hypothetical protein
MNNGDAIELYRGSGVELSISKQPQQVLEEATRAAKALQAVIAGKRHKIMFNDKQYLEFDDWQTAGIFYNLTVKVQETHFVQFGDVMGWEATADVLNTLTGQVVSRAEAMCLNDEDKWSSKNKYEWRYCLKSGGTSKEDPGPGEIIWEDNPDKPGKKQAKKERVFIGEVKVPQFQLRSMAQTRACAKAFRNVLSWVIVLAGYGATPAEELSNAKRVANIPASGNGPVCSKCENPMRFAEKGTTKTGKNAGKDPEAYWKCFTQGCNSFMWDKDYQAQRGNLEYSEATDPIQLPQRKSETVKSNHEPEPLFAEPGSNG